MTSTNSAMEEEVLAHLRIKVKAVRSEILADNKALEDLKTTMSQLKFKIEMKEESRSEEVAELKQTKNEEDRRWKTNDLKKTDDALKRLKDQYADMELQVKGIEKDVLIAAVKDVFRSEVEIWKFNLEEWSVSVNRWKEYFAILQKEQDDFRNAGNVKIPPGSSPVHTDVWICDDSCPHHRKAKEEFYLNLNPVATFFDSLKK